MSLTRTQRDKISQFAQVTGAGQKFAFDLLRKHQWSVDVAVESFFEQGRAEQQSRADRSFSSRPAFDTKKCEAFMSRYADGSNNNIGPEGIELLCKDLAIDPLDPVILVISYYCNAETMGIYTSQEFMEGMQKLQCESLDKLKNKLPELRQELVVADALKRVYSYVFTFALEKGQKTLSQDLCIEFWNMLLTNHFPLLPEWIAFVRERVRNTITKDTWVLLFDFATQVKADLSNYDEDGAWPVLLDEFAEYIKEKRKQ